MRAAASRAALVVNAMILGGFPLICRDRGVRSHRTLAACRDDVGGVRGAVVLGGGGEQDLRDGILTLPAVLAIRDPAIGALFCKTNPDAEELSELARAFAAQLPEAEAHLDLIAEEARLFSVDPGALLALVAQTWRPSGR